MQRKWISGLLALALTLAALIIVPAPRALAAQCTSNTGTLSWATATNWSCGHVPGSAGNESDTVTIADGATVTINGNYTVASLAIGDGASGILQFDSTARTLTVSGDVTIAAGGTFQSATSGTVTAHVLSMGGNLTNNGTLDFSTNSNTAGAGITFTGASNATFSGTGGTTDVRTITINKGSSASSILELSTSSFTVQGVTTDSAGFLTLSNGTFKISGSFSCTNRTFSIGAYPKPIWTG